MTRFLPVVFLIAAAGCSDPSDPRVTVARVGSDVLYEDQLRQILGELPTARDSVSARTQYVNRWVETALLADEARRQGMEQDPEIRQLIEDNERSILASAVVKRLYGSDRPDASETDIREYFDRYKDQLLLPEPYVQVRYLYNTDRGQVVEARRLLQRALRGAGADTSWQSIARQLSQVPDRSIALQNTYTPASRLFTQDPELRDLLESLGIGQVAQIIESRGAFHLLQLVGRAQAGTVPEMGWVIDEIRQQLELQRRKEAFARRVQTLRNEAEARNAIEIH